MVKDSPLKNSKTQRNSRSKSVVLNEQLTLLYQLEQRKTAKLEDENRALKERVNNLLTKEDDERIELLVADKTRRKLAQLKAITERTIRSLESGLNEFRTFVGDIDEALEEEEVNGAMEPAKAKASSSSAERPLREFRPTLKRIPESPMISMPSSSRLPPLPDRIEELSFVDESTIFDEGQQQLDDELAGMNKEEAKTKDKIDEEKNEEMNEEKAEMMVQEEKENLLGMGLEMEAEEEEEIEGKNDDEKMAKTGDGEEEQIHSENILDGNEIEKTNGKKDEQNEEEENNPNSSPKFSIVNETVWTTARMEEDEEKEANSEGENVDEGKDDENSRGNAEEEEISATPVPSTVTIRRTASTIWKRQTQSHGYEGNDVSVVAETPANDEAANSTLTKEQSSNASFLQLSQFSGMSTPFSTPYSTASSSTTASGRQRRAAATKIGSYREVSINKKMRREY